MERAPEQGEADDRQEAEEEDRSVEEHGQWGVGGVAEGADGAGRQAVAGVAELGDQHPDEDELEAPDQKEGGPPTGRSGEQGSPAFPHRSAQSRPPSTIVSPDRGGPAIKPSPSRETTGPKRTPSAASLKNRTFVRRLRSRAMEIRVVERESDQLRLEFPRGEETLLIPLVEALQQEEKVVEARYFLGHPSLDRPSLYLRTKGEKPQQLLKRVLKELADSYGDLLQDFDKKADKIKA